MKKNTFFFNILTLIIPISLNAQTLVVTPSIPPAVNQGSTYQFNANMKVSWSLAPGSKGTIDASGLYHAPSKVYSKQSLGGCQLLPNNHIFNTKIDKLPVD